MYLVHLVKIKCNLLDVISHAQIQCSGRQIFRSAAGMIVVRPRLVLLQVGVLLGLLICCCWSRMWMSDVVSLDAFALPQ